ncbi:histidine kinase [Elizabethkingia argentiflava]|uniref:Histidine kinase n=2 Tax=Elizabethkingia argenteiflava TaxID=2681556 RepID=A0A845PZT4_9FLAO|nr:histidine kinase [Elizabethkingia argenteiflava]
MEYHWTFFLKFQHFVFFFAFILIIFFSQRHLLDNMSLIKSIVLNVILNMGVYALVYYYLVPFFYSLRKYPQFILYALICFLVSSLSRAVLEPVTFNFNFTYKDDYVIFLYNIYLVQSIVILMASFLGITKNKFLIEQDMIDLGRKQDQLSLNLLKSRISPHFLLNTLNNIYADSFFSSSENGSDSILQLSKLLQYVLYESGKEKVSVAQELRGIYALKELYQLRYKNKLDIAFDMDDAEVFNIIEVPPTILLTLFENALKHSAIGSESGSYIKLKCRVENGALLFGIINSVAEDKEKAIDVGYKGLGNSMIIKVLEKYYYRNFYFFSGSVYNNNYKTLLKINIDG